LPIGAELLLARRHELLRLIGLRLRSQGEVILQRVIGPGFIPSARTNRGQGGERNHHPKCAH
jgi:hypothetical protein